MVDGERRRAPGRRRGRPRRSVGRRPTAPRSSASSSPRSASTSAMTTFAPCSDEELHRGAADPPRSTGDDRHLAGELLVHRLVPPCRPASSPCRRPVVCPGSPTRAERGRPVPRGVPANTILSGGPSQLDRSRSESRGQRHAKTSGRRPDLPRCPGSGSATGTIASDTALSYHANHVIIHREGWSSCDRDRHRRHRLLPDEGPLRRPVSLLREGPRAVPGHPGAVSARLHGHGVRRGHRRLPRPGDVLELQLGHRSIRQVPGPARGRRHHRHHRDLP